uniref:Toll-like receptor 4 n=1 Tax=Sphenodon punctatus TaxID=8508 RepID=A0A8D0HC69_SPHPU
MFWRGALCPLTLFELSWAMFFWSHLAHGSPNPCLEVLPNINYKCMELHLCGIPEEIPPSTQILDLSFNPLELLTSNYFWRLLSLTFLDLIRCHIHTIEDGAFQGLHNLSTLILTGNPLQILGPRAFYGLTSLQKLVAVEANISSLADLPIGHLLTLQELNVGNNCIDSMKLPWYLTSLTSLQLLGLQSNRITYIFKGDLNALLEKEGHNITLQLSINDIKHIQPGSFKGVHLQELSLRSCFANASIMRAGLQSLAGLSVKTLVIGEHRNNERVEEFINGLFDGLLQVELQEFVLISFRHFPENKNMLFNSLNNIPTVRLVHTRLSHISEAPVNFRVRNLEFKECNFKEVPTKILSSFKELRVLRMTKCKYLIDFREYFEGLTNLETLDLSENPLTIHLSFSKLQAGAPNLKHLNLSFNHAISWSTRFSDIVKLESLDLQHTRLDEHGIYPAYLFLVNLIYLDISYTDAHIIAECMFCGLEHLRVLKMAGNSFKDNHLGNTFKNLTSLHILDVSNCKVEQVSSHTFTCLTELRELNLSNNNLLAFDPVAYKPLWALTVLDLHSNRLTVLTEKALENLPDCLAVLDISQNMFDCSCDHMGFLKWAKESKKLLRYAELMVCSSPPHMKGVQLLSFDTSSCKVNTFLVVISVMMSVVGVMCLFLIYKYYFRLYYGLVLLSGCRRFADHSDTYDAFVIHSSMDEEWVRQELETTLEGGFPPFRLCLHYRDFIPGVPIITNIIEEGFLSSRNVIIVVSPHFMESRWCSFELEVAQTWQFLDGRVSLLFILLEEVDKALLERRLGLSRYLRRKTYLEWKEWEVGRHFFWRQLTTALLDGRRWNQKGT